jgi:hypothetical protein
VRVRRGVSRAWKNAFVLALTRSVSRSDPNIKQTTNTFPFSRSALGVLTCPLPGHGGVSLNRLLHPPRLVLAMHSTAHRIGCERLHPPSSDGEAPLPLPMLRPPQPLRAPAASLSSFSRHLIIVAPHRAPGDPFVAALVATPQRAVLVFSSAPITRQETQLGGPSPPVLAPFAAPSPAPGVLVQGGPCCRSVRVRHHVHVSVLGSSPSSSIIGRTPCRSRRLFCHDHHLVDHLNSRRTVALHLWPRFMSSVLCHLVLKPARNIFDRASCRPARFASSCLVSSSHRSSSPLRH